MQRQMNVGVTVIAFALAMVSATVAIGGQANGQGGAANATVEADPIRCWWRTSASAVRVGEPFSLILTCAVVENETTTVVADTSRLEPSAMQLPPFEVIGGQRAPDLRTDRRRFFQYQYTLRIINEDLFGKDAKIPSLQIGYNVQNKVQRGEAIRGRDRTYLLPTESVRVLSLVPNDALDIRDTPSWTFSDIDAQRFRARAFFVLGGVLFAAAALVVVAALVRWARARREEGAGTRSLVSPSAALRGAGRQMSAIRREAAQEGWTRERIGRALAAFRVAGSIALSRPVGQSLATGEANGYEGQLVMRRGFFRQKRVLVSGSATTEALARALAANGGRPGNRQVLVALHTALGTFTAAQFGREDKFDDVALSEALTDGAGVVRRLTFANLWLMRKMAVMRAAVGLGHRAWSR